MSTNLQIGTGKSLTAKIIGVGGAGASALEHIAQTDLAQLPLAAVHTHSRVLQEKALPIRLLVGINRTHGLGTGGDPELARVMGEEDRGPLEELCAGNDLIFLIAGLGGGTGTGLTPVIANLAKDTGALVLAIVTMPFEFEGARRLRQAQVGLQTLRAAADAVICLPNQKTGALLDAHTTLLDAFRFTNELLAQGIRGIWQMLTRPGLINIDFAYLYSALRGRHVESALGTAEASGEHRARDVVDQLLQNPLLDRGQALAEADELLVSLAGGSDLTLADINKVTEHLSRHTEKANLIFGTAIDEQMTGRISLTVIAAKNAKQAAAAEESVLETAPRASLKAPGDFDSSFFAQSSAPRPAPRFVAPPPTSTPERAQELLGRQPKGRKGKWKQEMLALEIISRGRFEKSEPTVHRGADLDVPTYVRRGVPLN
jgi:cell division protein FtsZ